MASVLNRKIDRPDVAAQRGSIDFIVCTAGDEKDRFAIVMLDDFEDDPEIVTAAARP